MKPYLSDAFNDDDRAAELYEWDRDLSAAFFRDISILEVALRNVLDGALVKHGEHWHRLSVAIFDGRTYGQIKDAWDGLPSRFTSNSSTGDRMIRGRLIAACMFGLWTSMLDSGGKTGLDGLCSYANHNGVWDKRVLDEAFPGARAIAGHAREELSRAWVHTQVREVHILRNRVAHHESLVNGYPVPGTKERRNITQAQRACATLAQMIDRDLAAYISETSNVKTCVERDPRIEWRQL